MKKIIIIFIVLLSLIINYNINAQWSSEFNLTNHPSIQQTWWLPVIAHSGNTIHLIFFDARYGSWGGLGYMRSTDSGFSWEEVRPLVIGYQCTYFSIVSSGNFVHVVWIEDRDNTRDVFYRRSTDGGTNWENEIRITNNTPPFQPVAWSSISAYDAYVYVIWRDVRTGNKIYIRQSTDYGATWLPEFQLVANNNGLSFPFIAQSGSDVYAVWIDQRHTYPELYFKRSDDNGASWSADIRLTTSPSYMIDKNKFYPILSVENSLLCLVWSDMRHGNSEIYFRRSTNKGVNWETAVRLTDDASSSNWPKVVAADSIIHVVWTDYRNNNKADIYYKQSTDAGVSWNEDERITTSLESGQSFISSIAVSDNIISLAWNKDVGGGSDIFYKRNPDFEPNNVNDNGELALTDFNLFQNYPNPFNPSTTIKFSVPEEAFVSLKIFNTVGQEVVELVYETKPAGNYSVSFDASTLSSGVYFYQLKATGPEINSQQGQAGQAIVHTRKMMLVK